MYINNPLYMYILEIFGLLIVSETHTYSIHTVKYVFFLDQEIF